MIQQSFKSSEERKKENAEIRKQRERKEGWSKKLSEQTLANVIPGIEPLDREAYLAEMERRFQQKNSRSESVPCPMTNMFELLAGD